MLFSLSLASASASHGVIFLAASLGKRGRNNQKLSADTETRISQWIAWRAALPITGRPRYRHSRCQDFSTARLSVPLMESHF